MNREPSPPALAFNFQQDYIKLDGVRYYALRIPYSVINELHQREFTALKQPSDELAVNDTVEAVGFDFVRTPDLVFECRSQRRPGELFNEGVVTITTFRSDAAIRAPLVKRGNLETLSMVMVDFAYDEATKVFELDEVYYAEDIAKNAWSIRFPLERLGSMAMFVFIDIYGNEARELISPEQFKSEGTRGATAIAYKVPAMAGKTVRRTPLKRKTPLQRRATTAKRKQTSRSRIGSSKRKRK